MVPTIFFQRNIDFSILAILLLFFLVLSSCESLSETEEISPEQVIVVQTEWKPDTAVSEKEQGEDVTSIKKVSSKQDDNDDPFFDNPEIYAVQVGSFVNRLNAENLLKHLTQKGYSPKITVSNSKGKQWNIVRLGPFSDKASAVKVADRVSKQEKLSAIVFLNSKIVKNISPKRENTKKVKTPKTPHAKNTLRSTHRIKYDKKARYSFQVGGLHTKKNALKHKTRLKKKGYPTFTNKEKNKTNNDVWYSVRIGYFKTMKDAVNAAAKYTDREGVPAQARPISD